MALMNLKFFSESLGMQTEVYVVIPQKSSVGEIGINSKKDDDKYKCLYLLHGLSDDHSIWLRRTSIERYAQEYGICVVMPCGARSFYTDLKYGEKYYTYIAKELPRIIREFLNVSEKREDIFIAGLSMGGYGALKIALRECGSFAAAAGLSSVADIEQRAKNWGTLFKQIWGEKIEIPPEDRLFDLARMMNERTDKPRIYMAVGTEDFLYDDNQKLRELFNKLNYDFTYKESKGSHSWVFWDQYIQDVLKWMFAVSK